MILDSWLAAYYWSEIPKDHGEFANIAIEMNGQDNYVTNVCVPSGICGACACCMLLCLSRSFSGRACICLTLKALLSCVVSSIVFDGGQNEAVLVNGAATVLRGVHSWGGTIVINGSCTLPAFCHWLWSLGCSRPRYSVRSS